MFDDLGSTLKRTIVITFSLICFLGAIGAVNALFPFAPMVQGLPYVGEFFAGLLNTSAIGFRSIWSGIVPESQPELQDMGDKLQTIGITSGVLRDVDIWIGVLLLIIFIYFLWKLPSMWEWAWGRLRDGDPTNDLFTWFILVLGLLLLLGFGYILITYGFLNVAVVLLPFAFLAFIAFMIKSRWGDISRIIQNMVWGVLAVVLLGPLFLGFLLGNGALSIAANNDYLRYFQSIVEVGIQLRAATLADPMFAGIALAILGLVGVWTYVQNRSRQRQKEAEKNHGRH